MSTKYHNKFYAVKIVGALLFGMPMAGIGVLFCMTVILAPVGLFFIGLSGWPLSRVIEAHERKKQEWLMSDRPLPVEMTPPWIMDLN